MLQKSLKRLDLGGNRFCSLEAVLRLLGCFPALSEVSLAGARFSLEKSINTNIEEISVNPQIQKICLDTASFTPAQLAAVALAAPGARVLSVCGCALRMEHLGALRGFRLLEQLVARENPLISNIEHIITFLRNISMPALRGVDIARRDHGHNKGSAVCVVSVDGQLHVFRGAIPGKQHVEIVLFQRPRPLGLRIPLVGREEHELYAQESAFPVTMSAMQVLKQSAAPRMKGRCVSMLETVKCDLIKQGEYRDGEDCDLPVLTRAKKLIRPESNRKHVLLNDGLDYMGKFVADELLSLENNSLLAESLQEHLEQFSRPQRRSELIMQASAHAIAESPLDWGQDRLFVTELGPRDDLLASNEDADVEKQEWLHDASLFDDRLVSRALFRDLDLIQGPTTENELLNHPIDVSGLTSFLPRGIQSIAKDVYQALRQALEHPIGDELRIDDEEILESLLAGANENV